MSKSLYAKDGKIYAKEYLEIYIPLSFFEDNLAKNNGASIRTFGTLFIKPLSKDKIKFFNCPIVIDLMSYDFVNETITVYGEKLNVMTLKYLPDTFIMRENVECGRNVAGNFLDLLLKGKLPSNLRYRDLMDKWWRNMEISGFVYNVPSKEYELVMAAIYRNPHNMKKRYGQYFGKHPDSDGLDYKTGNVREIVKNLSTFSGMIYEDIGTMTSNGINNALEGIEEPISPLEKIIHY